MREFAKLFEAIDQTTSSKAKIEALGAYFKTAPPSDSAWAVFALSGRRLPSPVKRKDLRLWACEAANLPDWLFEECYSAVADLAETISCLVPRPHEGPNSTEPLCLKAPEFEELEMSGDGLSATLQKLILPLSQLGPEDQRSLIFQAWSQFDGTERFLYNKLITGSFRVGVSQETVVAGLEQAFGIPKSVLSRRLIGDWKPTADFFLALVAPSQSEEDALKPYPFSLANPLAQEPESLGHPSEWSAEWKWDGIRCQAIRRNGITYLWSRGEGLIQTAFPEIANGVNFWPEGTVIDGEILAWGEGGPRPFSDLQKRLNRKNPSVKQLRDTPCRLIAFDLLESNGEDLRTTLLEARRLLLKKFVSDFGGEVLGLSPEIEFESWEDLARVRQTSAAHGAEGLMLKHRSSSYSGNRKRGLWWKWKVDPFTVDAVLVNAARGSGRRASLYTDYTFALWRNGELVPFAKAYSGLSDHEISEVDAIIRRTTKERFGPVRTVEPTQVFELAFEGVQRSSRHKSGLAVRFPRIARWRKDKKPEDADSVENVISLLEAPQ